MLRLTLVRHAKSSWDDPALGDFDRPLNGRGRRDAPLMAKRLASEPLGPVRLVSSPAVRALATAHAFAEVLGVPEKQVRVEPNVYDAEADTLLGIVHGLDDADRHVLLFGHNPGLSELAAALAPHDIGELPTCAVLTLRFESTHWRTIGQASTVERYLVPKKE
ncbi:MAG: histidine phosphatase family protein [Nevskia sp.]|nr:histidine phosphatase family protein [Nevskia sp.]